MKEPVRIVFAVAVAIAGVGIVYLAGGYMGAPDLCPRSDRMNMTSIDLGGPEYRSNTPELRSGW